MQTVTALGEMIGQALDPDLIARAQAELLGQLWLEVGVGVESTNPAANKLMRAGAAASVHGSQTIAAPPPGPPTTA